jgi:hypothetical protein
VVSLVPGEHVLLLKLGGHHLAAQRVMVEMDKELPLRVELKPLPKPCPPPPPPCPTCPKPPECPKLQLTNPRGFGLHFSLMGAFYLAPDRPFTGGPGVQVHATWRRLIFGLHATVFPAGEAQTDITLGSSEDARDAGFTTVTFNKANYSTASVQVEGGYTFPFRTSYLYATLGLGVFSDQVTYSTAAQTTRDVDATAFSWALAGGIEAMATSWLSIGAGLRIGAIHGDRLDEEPETVEQDVNGTTEIFVQPSKLTKTEAGQPYAVLWGSVTLHL